MHGDLLRIGSRLPCLHGFHVNVLPIIPPFHQIAKEEKNAH